MLHSLMFAYIVFYLTGGVYAQRPYTPRDRSRLGQFKGLQSTIPHSLDLAASARLAVIRPELVFRASFSGSGHSSS